MLSLLATGCGTSGSGKVVEHPIPRLYGTEDQQYSRTMGTLLGAGILDGNRIDVLLNGDEIFPAMLHAIRSAKTTITFETFIYWSGTIGSEFTNALSERAREGVKVHVLLDWIGSNKMDTSQLAVMEQAGVQVRKYHKPHWYQLSQLNNRTHRKLLVVDGRTGFTGGVGIADQWTGHAQDPEHWRDSHYRVRGTNNKNAFFKSIPPVSNRRLPDDHVLCSFNGYSIPSYQIKGVRHMEALDCQLPSTYPSIC